MARPRRVYALGGAHWCVSVESEVLDLFERYRQRHWWSSERVGQLFSTDLTGSNIQVSHATVLEPKRASFARVSMDLVSASREREALLAEGLHCVGLWHTHPEPCPRPSGLDERLAADHARAALSLLNGLLFVIVGNRAGPDDLFVAVHDGQRFGSMHSAMGRRR